MIKRLILVLALFALGLSEAQAQSTYFSTDVANAPAATIPFPATSKIPVIQPVGSGFKLYSWTPSLTGGGMLNDASNAVLPNAVNNLLASGITATTLPTQTAGTLGIGGASAVPTLAANAEGDVLLNSLFGLLLMGKGSFYDLTLGNSAGNAVMGVTTGTINAVFAGAVNVQSGIFNHGNLLVSQNAPTIASGGCTTGSAQSISANNGSAAFEITLGGATCGSTITLTMLPAPHNWVCDAHDITTPAGNVLDMTGTASTTAVVLTNYSRTLGTAANFTATDKLAVKCLPY